MDPVLNGDGWPGLQSVIERTSVSPRPRVSSGWGFLRKKRESFPTGIYILVYHSVVDPDHRTLWEQGYRKGEVTVMQLRGQLEFMLTHMTPLALSELPAVWASGGPDRPLFAVTFDDGFTNNLTHAHPVIRSLGLKPTVFVCSEFARGREYFFRVLASMLVQQGHAVRLAANLRSLASEVGWPDDGEELLGRMKDFYVADGVEAATDRTYRECLGDPALLDLHLNRDGVEHLWRAGWEIGNHTAGHRLLAYQSASQVACAIEDNARYWQQEGIELIDFLAYPIGRSRDVGPAVADWMARSPGIHGMFANGGINFSLRRKEWLRFSLGRHMDPASCERVVRDQIQRTCLAWDRIGEQ
ncbi:MAG: polysaccharide deacetylase family protein [Magnetococcales bacterium]|nr:polysaccharide deacetylase family protein [Magnetococcales bacterium]MBF0149405.1 polysaccharide deacetylase family protein [Magnetococcales bacterium]MBF0171947.1 polysaccharide deacetylase family protein [Magnetococcales bacterium]